MHTVKLSALALAVTIAVGPAAARADSYWEVENARANARAGGPVSERDKELLDRYGCLSGTKSAYCDSLRNGNAGYRAEKKRNKD